ncbi:MAG: aminotransferase class III-fold pyridoxal phosphate-dependent enzyme [Terriglobia bacterium]
MDLTGQNLYRKARRIIPGGTQLLSKRPEMFLPEQWPSYYSKAKGAEVWDLDGRKYVDMSYMGIGACTLGYADPDVDKAVHAAIDSGSMTTLNCPEEVELAELLCELHPWAERVRYARCGGEAMAAAVRVARASTGRDRIAFCGYHGWHDWYLAANLADDSALDGHLLPGLAPAGVPRGLLGTALPFRYNHLEELEEIVSACGDGLAAVVMEPIRNSEPQPGFLQGVRSIATRIGAVLIMDEISAGWRLRTGGAHLRYEIVPEMAVFAKAMSNGYAMAAIIGVAGVMEAFQSTFISSTYWTERVGPAAALATIRKHRRLDVGRCLIEIGTQIQAGWRAAATHAQLVITASGMPPLSHFSFDYEDGQAIRTLFTQIMLEKGFLATNAFYAAHAHQSDHVRNYLEAVEEAFVEIAEAVNRNEVVQRLKAAVAQTGFRRLA